MTFENYAHLYPEYKFIFCGDDGQGDLLAGEMMTEKHSEKLIAVFIHRVATRGRSLCKQSLSARGSKHLEGASSWATQIEDWESKNIYVTETYVHSASIACKLGLITQEALWEVGEAALVEFDEIRQLQG